MSKEGTAYPPCPVKPAQAQPSRAPSEGASLGFVLKEHAAPCVSGAALTKSTLLQRCAVPKRTGWTQEKAISIWESKNFFIELDPLPGAVEAVKQMANLADTDVFICTSPIKKYRYCPYEKVSRESCAHKATILVCLESRRFDGSSLDCKAFGVCTCWLRGLSAPVSPFLLLVPDTGLPGKRWVYARPAPSVLLRVTPDGEEERMDAAAGSSAASLPGGLARAGI
nr:PREDICTED: 5'(3')-deoxyribonucleotidase, mitochondrial [Struthio camelus australis]